MRGPSLSSALGATALRPRPGGARTPPGSDTRLNWQRGARGAAGWPAPSCSASRATAAAPSGWRGPARLTFHVAARLRQSPALGQQGRVGHRDPHSAAFFAGFVLQEAKEKGASGDGSGGRRVSGRAAGMSRPVCSPSPGASPQVRGASWAGAEGSGAAWEPVREPAGGGGTRRGLGSRHKARYSCGEAKRSFSQ